MISTVVMFILILALIFILPGKYMLLTSLYISTCIVIWDMGRKNINWANRIVLLVNLIICVLFYIAGLRNFLPYIGSYFYSSIMLLALITSIIGKPFTLNKKPQNEGEILFHKILCYIIAALNLMALILSLILMPNVLYIIIPLFLSFLSMIVGPKLSEIILKNITNRKIVRAL